jgi:hypothetical protein
MASNLKRCPRLFAPTHGDAALMILRLLHLIAKWMRRRRCQSSSSIHSPPATLG